MITWNILRAAGFGAYLVLFLAVVLGLTGTTTLGGRLATKQGSIGIHQFLATVGLLLLGVHLAGVALDPWIHFRVHDLFFPMLQDTYEPVAIGIGIVAMYAMAFITVTSWVRKKLSARFWRATHMLAIPAFAMAMIHGIFAGTDSVRPFVFATYLATGGIVMFLTLVRGFTATRKRTVVARTPATR